MSAPGAARGRLPRGPLVTGTLGTLLVAAGGTGAGAVPRSGVWRALAGSPTPRGLALGMSVVGVLLLVAAWWRLHRELPELTARPLLVTTACWALPLLAGPPVFSRDVYAYAGQALVLLEGLDPYAVGPDAVPGPLLEEVDEVWRPAPSPYGPGYLALAAGVVALTGERVVPAVLGLRALALLGLLLAAWALPRLAAVGGVPASRALWLGLANPLVLLHLVGGAHNDALMLGLLLAGLAVAAPPSRRDQRRGPARPGAVVAAAALVTGAALVKVPAAAGLAYLPLLAVPATGGWASRVRERLTVAAAAGATALVTAAVVGAAVGAGWGWVLPVDAGRARLSLFSPVTGVAVAAGELATAAGLAADRAPVVDAVLDVGVLLGLSAAALLLLLAPRLGPLRALGATLVVVVALGPVVQSWYLLWGVSVLAATVGPRAAAGLGAACGALSLSVLPSGRSLVRPPLYGLPTALAAALGGFVARTGRRRRPEVEHSR